MKGYVSVTFTDKQKQELLALKAELYGFYTKPSYRKVTKTVGILWWKREEVEYERIKGEMSERMSPFFYKIDLDSDTTTYRPNKTCEAVNDLASLLSQSNKLLLSGDLAGVLSWLIALGYLSSNDKPL